MSRPPLLVAATVIALVGVAAVPVYGGGSRQIHREELRIANFEVPRGWEIAPQPSYPQVQLLATTPEGGRMLLSVQRLTLGATADNFAADARATLIRQGYESPQLTREPNARVRLDAQLKGGKRVLRQIYIVDGDLGFVITIATPVARQARAFRELDEAVRSLVITPQGEAVSSRPSDAGTD